MDWIAFALGGILGAMMVMMPCMWKSTFLRWQSLICRRSEREPTLLSEEPMKMVLLVRGDLQMSKGKMAAQCAHAAVAAYKTASTKATKCLKHWELDGQAKMALRVDSEAELVELIRSARQAGLVADSIKDAGRTQLVPGTRTVGAIGPAPARLIDLITGHLKLF
jgi:PTH2 family peptidyl-tRNA hydrolase